jgi:hypothetical protein
MQNTEAKALLLPIAAIILWVAIIAFDIYALINAYGSDIIMILYVLAPTVGMLAVSIIILAAVKGMLFRKKAVHLERDRALYAKIVREHATPLKHLRRIALSVYALAAWLGFVLFHVVVSTHNNVTPFTFMIMPAYIIFVVCVPSAVHKKRGTLSAGQQHTVYFKDYVASSFLKERFGLDLFYSLHDDKPDITYDLDILGVKYGNIRIESAREAFQRRYTHIEVIYSLYSDEGDDIHVLAMTTGSGRYKSIHYGILGVFPVTNRENSYVINKKNGHTTVYNDGEKIRVFVSGCRPLRFSNSAPHRQLFTLAAYIDGIIREKEVFS